MDSFHRENYNSPGFLKSVILAILASKLGLEASLKPLEASLMQLIGPESFLHQLEIEHEAGYVNFQLCTSHMDPFHDELMFWLIFTFPDRGVELSEEGGGPDPSPVAVN